jgi:D-tyrosyl-tRNA(Tyr) deacylase
MRVTVQRVLEASVKVEGEIIGEIKRGLLIFLGIEDADSPEDIDWLTSKISKLRIFSDDNAAMNRSALDIDAEFLVVSQFTLFATTKKGNRPSFTRSGNPEFAQKMCADFVNKLSKNTGKVTQTGRFGADMQVALINDGPLTINIDSKNRE